jgi:signal transduction histidine kinase
VRSVSLLALAVILAALAAYVWRARPENPVNRWFALFTFAMGGWVLGIAGVESERQTEFWGRVTFAAASFIPATLLAFSRVFPDLNSWPSKRLARIALIAACGWALLSVSTPLVAYDISKTIAGIQRSPGVLYPAFAAYFLACSIAALWVFIDSWRRMRGLARAQLQYLSIGVLILSVGGITTNLLIPISTGRSTYSWLGPYFALPLVMLVGHAIIRHRLMDLRPVIHRGLVYALLTATASGVIILTRHWGWPASSERWPSQTDVLIVLFVTLAMISVPVQAFVSRLIDPYLYRGRIEYSSALREATHRLSRLMPPAELAAELRFILTEAFIPESFTMVARPPEGGALEDLSHESGDRDLLTVAALTVEQSKPSVLVVNPSQERAARRSAHEALRQAGIEIVVALGRRGQTLGAVLLGPRRSGDAYFARDLAFIESLAELASIALENSLLYRQRIQMLEYSDRLLESLDSAVVAIDVEGKITSFNTAARHLFRLDEDARGLRLDVLPSEVSWALALAITGEWRPHEIEASIDHEASGVLPVILSTAVLHDDRENVSGALVVVTDLSRVKALERNQRRIEHLATMARFYAGIAHEIRSPLAAISNFISMLPDRFDDPEYRDTAARLLPIEVGRIVRLADRLRLMAPSEDGKLNVVALSPLLTDIVALHAPAAEEQRTRIVLQAPDNIPKILGDPGQLVQLFINILRNGIESMPDGGTVTITVLGVRGRNLKDRVLVRVTDEGTGIEAALRSKIFEPFFTTKPSGTGLGLSICQEIADFHRARLTILPRLDRKGTEVQVDFAALSEDLQREEPVSLHTYARQP